MTYIPITYATIPVNQDTILTELYICTLPEFFNGRIKLQSTCTGLEGPGGPYFLTGLVKGYKLEEDPTGVFLFEDGSLVEKTLTSDFNLPTIRPGAIIAPPGVAYSENLTFTSKVDLKIQLSETGVRFTTYEAYFTVVVEKLCCSPV